MQPGATLIDHSTSSPALAQKIAAKALQNEINFVDAPVCGGDNGAQDGSLIIMAGGTKQSMKSVRGIMDSYSVEIAHMGGAGAGQHSKLAY